MAYYAMMGLDSLEWILAESSDCDGPEMMLLRLILTHADMHVPAGIYDATVMHHFP